MGLEVRAGLLPRRDLIVPAELVAGATDTRVVLRVSRDDVLRQPAFDPTYYLPLTAEAEGYKTGDALASIYGGAPRRRAGPNIASSTCCEEQHVMEPNLGATIRCRDGEAGVYLDATTAAALDQSPRYYEGTFIEPLEG